MTAAFRNMILVMVGTLALANVCQANRVFSWDDHKGVKNYSSQPPKEDYDPVGEYVTTPSGTNVTPVPEENRLLVKPKPPVTDELSKQEETCAYYRSIVTRYEKDGVRTIDPATGESKLLTGDAAAQSMKSAKEAVKIFCQP